MRAPSPASLAIALLAVLWIGGPGHSAASLSGDGPAPRAAEAPRYALRASGIPDSLLHIECGGAAALARLWQRPELESLAGRLRDDLARLGRYDATLRLTLTSGNGTAPGTASLVLVTAEIPTPPAPGPLRSVAIVTTTGGAPVGSFDPAGAFARGSGGGATPEAIASGIDAIRDDAIAAGRYAASVAIDSVVRSSDQVRVYVRVAAGPAITLEALELPGATATRPSAAASISGLRPGRTLNPAILADARERLVASDLFATVGEPRLQPGSEPARARVVIPVEEASASSFQGAIGMGSGGGLTGLLDISLGNIGGSGRAAGAHWAGLGDGNSDYALSYREPALFGRPIDASFQLQAQVAESLYTQTRWALGFGMRPVPLTQASLAIARTSSVYSGVGRGSSGTWSLLGRVERQGLAPRANPVRGFGASVEVETGKRSDRYPGYPEIQRSLLREAVALQGAASLGGRRVLFAGLRAEQVSLGDGAFPAEELLYLGGSNGLRGHRDRAYAGNRILTMSLEQRWLTGPTGGRGYFFLDAARHELNAPVEAGVVTVPGAAGSLARSDLSDGWEMGYGVGLLTRLASGVAGLELGLRPGAALREATLHLRYSSHW